MIIAALSANHGCEQVTDDRRSQDYSGEAIQDDAKLHEKLPPRDFAIAHCCPPGVEVLVAGAAVAALAGRFASAKPLRP